MSSIMTVIVGIVWALIWAVCIAIGLGLYWLPTILAVIRKSPDKWSIGVLNFFGFLIVAWIAALAWAMRNPNPASSQINIVNQPAQPPRFPDTRPYELPPAQPGPGDPSRSPWS